MATYNYECSDCEDRTEVKQSMNDSPLVKCESCGKDGLKRIIVSTAGSFRIGGVHNATTMWNVSNDPGPRRKGY